MPETCLFCRIAAGELPAHLIHEDDVVIAFLDIHPVREGHALVIPRAHHPWFEDMPEALAGRVMAVSQRIARELKAIYGVERVGMMFTGIHVPHAHAHLVPMHHVHDVTSACYMAGGSDSFTAPPTPAPQDLLRVAATLRARLAG